jgi:hypothetical protein
LPRSGISYRIDLEYALAAQWWHHQNLGTFAALPPYEQAYMVAVYRASNMIESVASYDQAKKQEAAAEAASKKKS